MAGLGFVIDPPQGLDPKAFPRGADAAERLIEELEKLAECVDGWPRLPSALARKALAAGATHVGGVAVPGSDSNVVAVRRAADAAVHYLAVAEREGIDIVRMHLKEHLAYPDVARLPVMLPLFDFTAVRDRLNGEVAYALDWARLNLPPGGEQERSRPAISDGADSSDGRPPTLAGDTAVETAEEDRLQSIRQERIRKLSDTDRICYRALERLCQDDNDLRYFSRQDWIDATPYEESTIKRATTKLLDQKLIKHGPKGRKFRVTRWPEDGP
ncbi:hypothetical protein [Botrimarina sp.]|uniref:hypothetical protein n=1 Tax=Botrimarina sp. TaxID=2795802 RepID=UPI0032EF971E